MATKKSRKKDMERPSGTFSVTLEEYLRRRPKAKNETTKGFQVALLGTALDRGRKSAAEWDYLYQLFTAKPVGVSMESWVAKNGGL